VVIVRSLHDIHKVNASIRPHVSDRKLLDRFWLNLLFIMGAVDTAPVFTLQHVSAIQATTNDTHDLPPAKTTKIVSIGQCRGIIAEKQSVNVK
jgi:hypothetical protein